MARSNFLKNLFRRAKGPKVIEPSDPRSIYEILAEGAEPKETGPLHVQWADYDFILEPDMNIWLDNGGQIQPGGEDYFIYIRYDNRKFTFPAKCPKENLMDAISRLSKADTT